MRKLSFIFLLLCSMSWGVENNRILYLMQTGNYKEAFEQYYEYYYRLQKHDYDLIQQIGLILLSQGQQSCDKEVQLMTLFGAGISLNERSLYILENGILNKSPEIQLASLHLLANYQDDFSNEMINRAMSSDFLMVRLEAAYLLADRRNPKALGQIESLMNKVNEQILPFFPQLLAMTGTDEAIKRLRRLLIHPKKEVRIEAVLSAARQGRDDLAPIIRNMLSHHDIVQQETCAYAIGIFKDETSLNQLELLSKSECPSLRLSALHALSKLGKEEAIKQIKSEAEKGDCLAIPLLAEFPETENILAKLLHFPDMQIRLNASIALLEKKDARCLPILYDILIHDARDLVCIKVMTPGKALSAWKIIPSAQQNLGENPTIYEQSLRFKEELMNRSVNLPEEAFLALADKMLEMNQSDLIPTVVHLLENLQTSKAITILKKHQQKVGAPLVRHYCTLALYRLNEEGPYEEMLEKWVVSFADKDLIQLRPVLPWESRDRESLYPELTPFETSRLLIETFEAFAQKQEERGINLLLHAIQYGKSSNRYALAGLLMRATQ